MLQHNPETTVELNKTEDSLIVGNENVLQTITSEVRASSVEPKSPSLNIGSTINSTESSNSILSTPCITAGLKTALTNNYIDPADVTESSVEIEKLSETAKSVELIFPEDYNESNAGAIEMSPIEQNTIDSTLIKPALVSPTTPSVPKERKRRIIIDDDDESPTFNPQRSNKKLRGKNRRSKHNAILKKQKRSQLVSTISSSFSDKANESAVFTSPEMVVSNKWTF